MYKLTAASQNHVEAIRQIDEKLSSLEKHYGMATSVVLDGTDSDPVIERIDGFDLMEWRYLVRERKSLADSPEPPGFSYALMRKSNPEPLPVGEYEGSVAA